jgi:hypothetical protein
MPTTDTRIPTVLSPGGALSAAASTETGQFTCAMATTPQDRHTSRPDDHALLERVAAGLRALQDVHPTDPSRAELPLRGCAHPDQAAP